MASISRPAAETDSRLCAGYVWGTATDVGSCQVDPNGCHHRLDEAVAAFKQKSITAFQLARDAAVVM